MKDLLLKASFLSLVFSFLFITTAICLLQAKSVEEFKAVFSPHSKEVLFAEVK